MLKRQSVYILCKYGLLAKFTAPGFRARQPWIKSADGAVALTIRRGDIAIHLESAAFVGHINTKTQANRQSHR